MKVAIFFAVYERLGVLKIFLDGLDRLKKDHPDIEWIPFGVYTNDDEGEILKKRKIHSLQYSNEFLGRKKNAGLKALMELDWDYMMEMGSDDLVRSELIDIYKPLWEQGVNVFGTNSCYFIETCTGKVAKWKHNYAIGAGRCIKRSVFVGFGQSIKVRCLGSYGGEVSLSKGQVEIYPYVLANKLIDSGMCELVKDMREPFGLWTDTRNIALDGDSEFRLGVNGFGVKVLDLEPMVVDIKSGHNIHSFDRFTVCDKTLDDVLVCFSKKEADGIRKLR